MSPSSAVSSEPLTSPSRSISPVPVSPAPSRPVSTSARAAGLESATDSSELTEEDDENASSNDDDDSGNENNNRNRRSGSGNSKSRSSSSRQRRKRGVVPGPMWDWVQKKEDEEDDDQKEDDDPPPLANGHIPTAATSPASEIDDPLANTPQHVDDSPPTALTKRANPSRSRSPLNFVDETFDLSTSSSDSSSDDDDLDDGGEPIVFDDKDGTVMEVDVEVEADIDIDADIDAEVDVLPVAEEEEANQDLEESDEEDLENDVGVEAQEDDEVIVIPSRPIRQMIPSILPLKAEEHEPELEEPEEAVAAEEEEEVEEEEEEDEEEEEPEAESDLQPPQRAEALDILGGLEIKFAHLRERLYVDKMEDAAMEEDYYLADKHPEVLFLIKTLDERKEQRLQLAKRKRELEEAWCRKKREADERAVWSWWAVRKEELRDQMVAETNGKRRRLEREKRSLESKAAVRRPLPNPRYIPDNTPRTIKEIIKHYRTPAYLSQPHSLDGLPSNPFHPESTYTNPILPTLSFQEIVADVEIISASRRQIAQRNAYFQQQQHQHQQPPHLSHSNPPPPQHPAYSNHPGHSSHSHGTMPEYNAPPFPGVGGEYGVIDGSGYSNMPPPPNPREVTQSQQLQMQPIPQQSHYAPPPPPSHHSVASRPFMSVPHSHTQQPPPRTTLTANQILPPQSSSLHQLGGGHSNHFKMKRSPSPPMPMRSTDQIMLSDNHMWEEQKPRKDKESNGSRKGYGIFPLERPSMDVEPPPSHLDRHSSRHISSAPGQLQPPRHYQSPIADTLPMRSVPQYGREPAAPTPPPPLSSDRPETIPFAFPLLQYSWDDGERHAGPSRSSPRPSSRHTPSHPSSHHRDGPSLSQSAPPPSSVSLPSVLTNNSDLGSFPLPQSKSAPSGLYPSQTHQPPPAPPPPPPSKLPPPPSNSAFVVPNVKGMDSSNSRVTAFMSPVPPSGLATMPSRDHVLPPPPQQQTGTSVG